MVAHQGPQCCTALHHKNWDISNALICLGRAATRLEITYLRLESRVSHERSDTCIYSCSRDTRDDETRESFPKTTLSCDDLARSACSILRGMCYLHHVHMPMPPQACKSCRREDAEGVAHNAAGVFPLTSQHPRRQSTQTPSQSQPKEDFLMACGRPCIFVSKHPS